MDRTRAQVGIDQPDEDGRPPLLDPPPPCAGAHAQAMERDVRLAVSRALMTLTHREESVMRMRFGIGQPNGREMTLEEVGAMYGVTRERIRQLEAKALRKLKHPSRSRNLRDLLEDDDDDRRLDPTSYGPSVIPGRMRPPSPTALAKVLEENEARRRHAADIERRRELARLRDVRGEASARLLAMIISANAATPWLRIGLRAASGIEEPIQRFVVVATYDERNSGVDGPAIVGRPIADEDVDAGLLAAIAWRLRRFADLVQAARGVPRMPDFIPMPPESTMAA